jgi:hypothetical protein
MGDDNRFASAQGQIGGGGFVGHAAGQAQNVGDGLLARLVGHDARAAQGWPQDGAVDGHDGFQARAPIRADHKLFVFSVIELGNQVHRSALPFPGLA